MRRYALAILGAGNMAEAIVRGLIAGGGMSPDRIITTNRNPGRRAYWTGTLGVTATADNRAAVADADVVMLGIKPQMCRAVLPEVADALPADATVVSIIAGVTAAALDAMLHGRGRIVRTMPNTPVLVGAGMVAVAKGPRATVADIDRAVALFAPAAAVVEVDESKLDAVTAVSGSGPAYFFLLVEHMTAAGVSLGLSPQQAHRLATQTAFGAAKMMTAAGADAPRELRRKVTSLNGVTQAAIEHMEGAGLPAIVADAMAAAVRRSRELGA